ncbi:FecR family protein [Chitinophaga silvisoli]|uniref:FecR family protein n=1 Tax=Chitinophaga silvisoli TaxID=2291814 RepID=A0A3E1NN08_9BACT|nr:FecR domain-containing protein [Chitinophaga silvisoli]RFM29310.1 FecR family protein [Chitinophaga silvisoli]
MTAQELKFLLDKYKQNTITPDDKNRLFDAIDSGEHDELLSADILQSLRSDVPSAGWENEDHSAILDAIFQADQPEILTVVKNKRRFYLYAAAAVTAGIILTTSLLYRKDPEQAPTLVKTQVLAPGSTKAMLTLADGTQIPLDSAANGTLAQQGNTQISNKNGKLSYQANGGNEVMYNTVTTPHGGQYQLTLADGSKVWLNAASSIRFPTAFTGKERQVSITGEAYFEIVQQSNQPFSVQVKAAEKDMTVKVLGTSFNIMAYADEKAVKTALIEGAVQVEHGSQKNVLKPGLEASLTDNTFAIAPADLEQTLAWKDGKFRFRSTNIKTIMRQLSRWYDMEVAYNGDVSDIDLTGVISRREDAGKLLKALEATQRVHFEVNGHNVTVSPATSH